MKLLLLFWEFFKIGLFSVGGGMATVPFLYDLAEKTGWYTQAQILDMLAVSESTPGPIGINMATYVGYVVGGFPGGVLATLGVILPGLILVLVIAMFLEKFRGNRIVEGAHRRRGHHRRGGRAAEHRAVRTDRLAPGSLQLASHHPGRRTLAAHERCETD